MNRIRRYGLRVALVLGAVELTVRLCFAIPYIADRRIFVDELSLRRAWIRRHQLGVQIHYHHDVYDPTKGWRPKSNLRNVPAFEGKTVSTTSRGFRGLTEHAFDKRSGTPRLLLLGDSFTFGHGVGDTETYAAYLQETLPWVEVINMGVQGYGHDQMLIWFEEEGVKYRPDIVILGFVQRDMSRNLLRFRDYAKPRFVVDGGGLRVVGSPVPTPEDVLKWDWARPRVRDLWSIVLYQAKALTGADRREEAALTARILDEIVRVVERVGAVPLFVYLPEPTETATGPPLTDGEEFLFRFCDRNGRVRCVSARPEFARESAQGAQFEVSRHWRPAGNRVLAKAISRYLIDEALLSPPAPGRS